MLDSSTLIVARVMSAIACIVIALPSVVLMDILFKKLSILMSLLFLAFLPLVSIKKGVK